MNFREIIIKKRQSIRKFFLYSIYMLYHIWVLIECNNFIITICSEYSFSITTFSKGAIYINTAIRL